MLALIVLLALLQLGLGQSPVKDAAKSQDVAAEFPGLDKIVLPPAVQGRVVGGEATTIEKLGGYLVALRYQGEFVCGGTLIEDRIVISAAHCFLGRTKKYLWEVSGGISRLNENGIKGEILDYVVPQVFKEETMNMDVAVLLLLRPLKGPNISKIGLCSRKLLEGLQLTVSGWGLSDPQASNPHQNVRTVRVPVLKKSQCKHVYKSAMPITDSMLCAGVLGQKDACTFDSGGPIVYQEDNQNELCGIVSFGIGCASAKYPGVYTDVNYVKPFIENSMKQFGIKH
ncbi:seminase [Drosophila novamexicana]|uniref:seminase n=1 Tax=Drosophila novamexicana TaxID=47314 RepID=UPI0011E5A9BC|nr:seminase [Drosophila novamexicana]